MTGEAKEQIRQGGREGVRQRRQKGRRMGQDTRGTAEDCTLVRKLRKFLVPIGC